MKAIRCFLWAELVLCGASLLGTACRVRENYQGLSFGGFMALFLLVLLVPCALVLAGCIALHWRALKAGKPLCAVIASVLQLIAPLLWLGLLIAFGYRPWTPDPGAYWCEWAMAAGMAAGAAGLPVFLGWLAAVRIKTKTQAQPTGEPVRTIPQGEPAGTAPPEEPVNTWHPREH